ncbi:MAG: DUF5686 and carboxypeptidase regulatory-like domain-containing protein [Paludibacter sp.]|nr:DUF5686 and carboxypeptidase regulatory-like domain-containing protein [Paludibacter sp.]
MKKLFPLLSFLCFSVFVLAQETLLVGQVLDENREPLADVSVYFKGTYNGMQTNEDGYFMVRTDGSQTVVVFSHLGYKKQELKLKRGESAGTEIIMYEDIRWLPEVFVRPGENPALELMQKVRAARVRNNMANNPNFTVFENAEKSIFLINKNAENKIFKRLKNADLTAGDSTMTIPIFNEKEKFKIIQKTKTILEKTENRDTKTADLLLSKLSVLLNENVDFYQNTVFLFGKSFVSPLSSVGNSFYKYFLVDTIYSPVAEFYQVDFRSKNKKNLAFNGKMWINKYTYELCYMEAELPHQANLNFIENLKITQDFDVFFENKNDSTPTMRWYKSAEKISCNLDYKFFADTASSNVNLYLTTKSAFDIDQNSVKNLPQTDFTEKEISEKLAALKSTSLYKTALYIADICVTGNAKVGKIDIGNVNKILRLSQIEGLRVALPVQTNEDFLKNFSFGGHLGYGFKNREIKYSAFAKWKLPTRKKCLFSATYFNDYRRIEYDYNDFFLNEEPFADNDESFKSTILIFRKAKKMNLRHELSASFTNDWNNSFETSIILRSNKLFANEFLPFIKNNNSINSFTANSITFAMRFSKNQRKYEDHLQRIYLPSPRPVLYFISEFGKYDFGSISKNYGKFSATISQTLPFELGTWKYAARADLVLGAVPFPLLAYPYGNETHDYNLLKFSMLDYLHFPADKNLQLHNELIFNGIIFNHIPYIQRLNLREMLTFKIGCGWLNKSKHATIADFPIFMQQYTKPYAEFGAGITNILQFFSFQVICSTPNSAQNHWNWSARFYLSIGF